MTSSLHAHEPALVDVPPTHENAQLLGDPRYLDESAAVFRQLRRLHGPVAPVLLHGRVPAWLVLGYRAVQHVTDDSRTYARDTARRWNLYGKLPADWPLWPLLGGGPTAASMLFTEGAEHHKRAGALNTALDRIDRIEFRARCEHFAHELITSFSSQGTADLMSAYAMKLPAMALAWALGVPQKDIPVLVKGFCDILDGGNEAITGQQKAREVITHLVHEVRTRPQANVAGRLAAHPAGLDDAQLIEDLLVTILAGHQTTAYWAGNSARLMLTDPRHANTLARGQLPVRQAIRQVLWDDTPTQVYPGRFTTRQVDLGHYSIPPGDLLLLGLAGANTDPHIFPDPAAAHRSRAYLSFSAGPHGCPVAAQSLAEIITSASVEVLLTLLPDLHLACDPAELRWVPGAFMRGLTALPVRFSPTTHHTPFTEGTPWI